MQLEVTRKIDDLTEHTWRFWFYDRNERIYLDTFLVSRRETTRHKFKTVKQYVRTSERDTTLPLDQVPFPDDVAIEAKRQFVDRICVQKAWP